jgi:hypothetical protein
MVALGCDRQDSASRAIEEAKTHLATAGAGGSAAAPKYVLDKKFKEAIAALKASEGSESTGALQSAIEAGALGGQGDVAADAFRQADARLLAALNVAKAKVNLYTDQRALEAALKGYDPQGDIAHFDDQVKERERELAEAKRALSENTSKVDALRAEARDKAFRGQSMMESVGVQREQMMNASPGERAALASQVSAVRRDAELVMKDSELLEAEAARIAPRSGELELLVRQAERQIAALNAAKDRARDLAKSRADASAEAARGAETTAREVAEAVALVRKVFDEEVKPAFDAAAAKLSQSASKLTQSRGGPDQKLLTLMNGSAAQSLGSLQREFGESVARSATVLGLAAALTPAVEGASEWSKAAAELRAQSMQAMETALEQYEKATSAFDSAGGSAEVRERVEALAARVEQTRIRLGGKKPEEPAPAEGEAPTPESPAETPAENMAPAEEPAPESGEAPASETPVSEPK